MLWYYTLECSGSLPIIVASDPLPASQPSLGGCYLLVNIGLCWLPMAGVRCTGPIYAYQTSRFDKLEARVYLSLDFQQEATGIDGWPNSM